MCRLLIFSWHWPSLSQVKTINVAGGTLFQLQVIKAGLGSIFLVSMGKKFHNTLSAYFNSSGLRENQTIPPQETLANHTSFQTDGVPIGCPVNADGVYKSLQKAKVAATCSTKSGKEVWSHTVGNTFGGGGGGVDLCYQRYQVFHCFLPFKEATEHWWGSQKGSY